MNTAKVILLILTGLLVLPGCSQPITYSLDDIPKAVNSPFTSNTLGVEAFEDVRENIPVKQAWYKSFYKERRITHRGGKGWWFNDDQEYKNKCVAPGITEMIVKHLNRSGLFHSVTLKEKARSDTDYILQGGIKTFEGYKEKSVAAQIGAQFGLIGALATSGVTSQYEATTVLNNVKLIRRDSQETIWQGVIEGKIEGEDYADAQGFSAYTKANISLKEAVNQLIDELKETTAE